MIEVRSVDILYRSHSFKPWWFKTQARNKKYATSKEFDMDMTCLFEKARRYHEPITEAYGHVLLLQVSLDRFPTWRGHYISNIRAAVSCLNIWPSYRWSSLYHYHQLRLPPRRSRYNPTRTRTPRSIRLVNWLHLSNLDDPSRAIVAQVFKCWVSDEL